MGHECSYFQSFLEIDGEFSSTLCCVDSRKGFVFEVVSRNNVLKKLVL